MDRFQFSHVRTSTSGLKLETHDFVGTLRSHGRHGDVGQSGALFLDGLGLVIYCSL